MASRRTPQTTTGPFLTPGEAAERINQVLSTNWNARRIVRLARAGQLDVERIDGRGTVRVHQDAIDRFLRQYLATNRVVPNTQVA